ncbi:hypothetical protein AAHN97_09395 [Chitinophaga niabensis]|uniref:hypothetical protein n=1 Tax=Chitinophaga niabensis TaxID=536979 RepID=UPI0031BA74CA
MKGFTDQEIYDALFGMLHMFHPIVPPTLIPEIIQKEIPIKKKPLVVKSIKYI